MTVAVATTEPPADSTSAGTGDSIDVSGSAGDWVRAVAAQSHQHTEAAAILAVVGELSDVSEGENAARVRRCGANLMLDHLGRMPGEAWQQRWEASGLEQVGPADFRQAVCAAAGFPATAGRLWQLTSGLGALMTVDVIRLSFGFLLGAVLNHTWSNLLAWRGDPHADILDRVPCTP